MRGSECRRVMPRATALRRRLEPWVSSVTHPDVDTLSVVMRVGGSLGTFSPPGVTNVTADSRTLACDLVIEDFGWDALSEDRIDSILAAISNGPGRA